MVKDGLPREDPALVLEKELAPNEERLVLLQCIPSFGGYIKAWALFSNCP